MAVSGAKWEKGLYKLRALFWRGGESCGKGAEMKFFIMPDFGFNAKQAKSDAEFYANFAA